jgi:hypothetical protein
LIDKIDKFILFDLKLRVSLRKKYLKLKMTESDDLFNELVQSFIALHSSQLKSSGVPEIYWSALFRKIREEVINHDFLNFGSLFEFKAKF